MRLIKKPDSYDRRLIDQSIDCIDDFEATGACHEHYNSVDMTDHLYIDELFQYALRKGIPVPTLANSV